MFPIGLVPARIAPGHDKQFWRTILKIYRSVTNKFSIFLFLLFYPILVANSADTSKLLKAIPLSQTAIQLQFDGQLQSETAEDLNNYQIAPDVELEYALLDQRLNRVLLLTSPLEIRANLSPHASEFANTDTANPAIRQ